MIDEAEFSPDLSVFWVLPGGIWVGSSSQECILLFFCQLFQINAGDHTIISFSTTSDSACKLV